MKNMAETVSVTVILWIFLLSSGLISAYNGINIQHPIIMVECKCRTTENHVLMMRIDVTLESNSEKLAWIGGGNPGVNHNNFLNVKVFESGKTELPASLSVLLMGYNPAIGAVFNCSTLAMQNGDRIEDSYQIYPSSIDGKNCENYGRLADNSCAGKVPTPVIIVVIILAILVLFLAFVAIKFICIDQGRCRALYSPMLPRYSDHIYPQKEDNYNFSQGNNHYSVAWNDRRTTKEGGSRMMLGSSKSLSKSNFPYRAHNGSVRSMPPRMPQPPPPPPPPLPRDGPPKKLPAHQSNGSLQSSVTYALPQDAIDEELPTPPQDAIDQERPALPQDVTDLGLPATGEEDGTDVSSEHYKVPKDSSVNRLSCSL